MLSSGLMVFDYNDYICFLNDYLDNLPSKGRGVKTLLADKLNCKSSFISQVFSRKLDFTLEQGLSVAEFLKLSDEETEYFLLLIDKERSGSYELKQFIQKKINKIKNDKQKLKNVFKYESIGDKESQLIYFSSIDHILVHLIVMSPEKITFDDIQRKSSIERNRLEKIVDDLIRIGLIEYEQSTFRTSSKRIHLPDDASIIANYHSAWRIHTMRNLHQRREDDIHYSSAMSVSKETADEIKKIIRSSLKETSDQIKESDPGKIYSFCLDFYEICGQS